MLPLTFLQLNKKAKIIDIKGDKKDYLQSKGIFIFNILEVVENKSQSVIFKIDNTKYVISYALSDKVYVEII